MKPLPCGIGLYSSENAHRQIYRFRLLSEMRFIYRFLISSQIYSAETYPFVSAKPQQLPPVGVLY